MLWQTVRRYPLWILDFLPAHTILAPVFDSAGGSKPLVVLHVLETIVHPPSWNQGLIVKLVEEFVIRETELLYYSVSQSDDNVEI